MRRASLFLVLTCGCKGCGPDEDLPEYVAQVDDVATGVWVGAALSDDAAEVPVYATNLLGAVVPASGVGVTAEGLSSSAPDADATGWGSVTVDAGPGAWPVTATYASVSATSTAWIVNGEPPAWASPAVAPTGVTTAVALAGGGVAWSEGGNVWWSAWAGGVPTRVLDLTEPVIGLQAVQLDNDGVGDLVAWSGAHVAVLRGRSAGGLVWATGFSVASAPVVGVAAVDLNGDSAPDLAIAASDGATTQVAWIEQDDGRFTYTDALEVDYGAWSLSAEDLDDNGEAEITLLSADALIRRYTRIDGEWVASQGSEFELGLGAGATLLPGADFDGDGIEDLVAMGPQDDGAGWQAYIISTPDRLLYRLYAGTENDPLPSMLWGASADMDGDGLTDLVMATDHDLRRASWSPEVENFTLYLHDIAAGAPIAVGDTDGDLLPDLVAGGADVRLLTGHHDNGSWGVVATEGPVMDLNVAGDPWLGDLDGDGVVDFASIAAGGSGAYLQAYLGAPSSGSGDETFVSQGGQALGTGTTALDLAVCGRSLYALVDDGGTPTLYRSTLDPVEGLQAPDWGIAVPGESVACGSDGESVVVGGADGSFAWIGTDGSIADASSPGPVHDLALYDDDGDGTADAVAACATAECSVVAADFDGDGREEAVYADATGLTLGDTVTPWAAAGEARLSVGDADGDGLPDLVAQADGVVRVYRVVAGALTPPRTRYVVSPVTGPAGVGDLGGDGVPDLFLLGRDDDPADDTNWEGVILYLPGS